ncbi:hypothetical protein DFQ28_001547 [Apophysomyces sp. BC1034]|nr:hypothetical protein DFQ30_007324 [Apophysomyces sp. BC1015]KAG0180241.1 hypothetical protein DFQ29_001018 [Apophysomyces sp. BC1021]KAG0190788.1 hypothetical protein DFQ28_001547 [Apophysomyces sp. BC1034]
MVKTTPLYTLPCILAAVAVVQSAGVIKGLAPEKHSMYSPSQGNWQCLDGSKSIPYSAINDDYCDCLDGFDEPGTSACPNGQFYCENKGHIPAYIKSYAVNDGICDEACCDGSDEVSGLCPNRCKPVAAEYAKTQAKLQKIWSAGVSAKKTLIDGAKVVIQGWAQEKSKLGDELAILRAELEQHERTLNELESREKGNQARAASCKSCQKQEAQVSKLSTQVTELQDDIELLLSLLHDLKRDHNHNFHDMAVKAALSGYDEFVRERDAIKNSFENEDASDDDFVVADEIVEEAEVQAGSEELEAARKTHKDLQSQIQDKEDKLKEVTDELEKDYGHENEWLKLKDVCVEKNEGEYTYSLCVLGDAYQKSNRDGMRTNLGRFETFDDNYRKHMHTRGTRCWNGPERSVHAFFECGSETEILEVTEPEKCEYHFRMRSPALCASGQEEAQPEPVHRHEEL